MNDPLTDLSNAGVSIWLDDLSRERLVSGSLADLAARDHVVGVTTNPSIFARAIAHSDTYGPQIADLSARGVGAGEAMRALTTFDVRWACDVLRPVYDATAAWTAGCRSRSTHGSRTTPRPCSYDGFRCTADQPTRSARPGLSTACTRSRPRGTSR